MATEGTPELVPVSLFVRQGGKGYSVGAIQFDLILQESHELVSDITSHAVQDGSVISDHIRNKLREGKLTGRVTNWSIYQNTGELPLAIELAIQSGSLLRSRSSLGLANKPVNRAMDAYTAFKYLMAERALVDIVCIMDVYKSVAVSSVKVMRNEGQGDYLDFMISFKEIKTAKLASNTAVVSVDPKNMLTSQNQQAAAQKDSGQQTGLKS